jgi:Holliday junction resolvase RusA-like endonuclease
MSKRRRKLVAKIPNFMKNAKAWRRAIHAAVSAAQVRTGLQFLPTDKFAVEVIFTLANPKLTVLDLDNRLKDVLDALQGFIGEKGKSGALRPIIPDDSQIYLLIAEKRMPPKAMPNAPSQITIWRYDSHRRTAGTVRSTKKSAAR